MSDSNPQQGSTIETKLNDFLDTLKIHNKDLDACFNDALAVRHIKELIQTIITTETTKAKISFYKDWLDWLDRGNETSVESIVTTMRNRLAALQKEQNV